MNKEDLIKSFRDLFKCREDVYANGYITPENKAAYPPARDEVGKDLPLTDDVIYEHFKGDTILGVYPLIPGESEDICDMTHWVAIDFDEGEDPIRDAFEQSNKLAQAGLSSYVERSRSGKGAHVWLFFDGPISAKRIRSIVKGFLIDSSSYDRMFPNQDSVKKEKYGNLIALPYNGKSYKEGNSAFIDREGNPIPPKDFIPTVVKNRVTFVEKLYKEEEPVKYDLPINTGTRGPRNLTGAMKVVMFSEWMKKAKERMSNQNQEPEFYALCCQFAQLEDGERLAYEYGRLHPYSDERIKQKFEQAKSVNMPHTCKTLRDEFGFESYEDIEYGVNFPYELANLTFQELMNQKKGKAHPLSEILPDVIDRTKAIYKSDDPPGWAYGWDPLDDLTDIRAGNLIVLGARTGIGKSSFAVALSANLARIQNVPVYYFSLEMDKEDLVVKLLGNFSEIDTTDISKANLGYREWRTLLKKQQQILELPIFIDDETKDSNRILDVVGALVAENGPGLVVIDYIELMSKEFPSESDMVRTSRIIVELKGLARALKVPVLALTNFNRQAERDIVEGQDPLDSWIRNSGLVEQTADVVLYVLGKKSEGLVRRNIRIQKERFRGAEGKEVILWFEKKYSRFYTKVPGTITEGVTSRVTIDANGDGFI
jgi:KaiC/GvpD/RAD55 family RecA-like ATPase